MKINGNLALNSGGQGEIQQAVLERVSSQPTFSASEKGRIYYNTTSNLYFYNDGTAWMPFATGGNATALQSEVDAIETALGSVVNASGVYQANQFTGYAASATSVTQAINMIEAALTGHNTFAELDDVTLTALANNQYARYNTTSSKWENHTLVTADLTDITSTATELNELHLAGAIQADFIKLHAVTSSAAELNILDGATLTTTELNYVDGVTSAIQDQLDGKQPLDAGLTALASFDTNGIIVQTATNTWAGRTTVAPVAGITITNPAGIAGNITFALADDLAALEGLASTGFAARIGASSWVERAITGSANRIDVTNGDGVAASPTIDLATVTNSGTGTFLKLATDGYGRVTGTTPVVLADIETLANTVYVQSIGDTMTGDLIFTNGATVTGLPSPTADTQAANKAYVDAAVTGLSWKNEVAAATTANITLSGEQTVDGIALVAGKRVLVKDQTTASENGIYVVASGSWTRALDMDAAVEFENATVFVQDGTANVNSAWVQTATVATVGTSAVSFVQFNGASGVVAGIGLDKAGNTLNINMGSGIVALPSDEVGIDLYSVGTSALILTQDGATSDTTTNAKLALKLATSGGLVQDSTGLYITANGVTNAMIANETISLDADDASTGSVALGGTLKIFGTTLQGISSALSGDTFTLTMADASYTQKGVASFNTADFTVTNGDVSIASIANSQLDNSGITVTGTTGSDVVSLGESFAIVGGSSSITTASATNSVTISIADAAAAVKGLASFNSAQFTVTAGAVDLTATLDDLTNVANADAAATGDLLTKTATDWEPITRAALLATQSITELLDVVTTTPASAQALIFDGTNWVNKKIYHLADSASGTSHVVTHNLGQKYANVTVVDTATDEVIIPQSITFDTANQLTVTLNSALALKIVVMAVA